MTAIIATAAAATLIRYLATNEKVSSLDFNGIAAVTGLAFEDISATLGEMIAAGLVRRDESRMIHNLATYVLTDAGHDALDELRRAGQAQRAAKLAEQERREAAFAASWTGDFCPLCALMGRTRCAC